MKCQSCLHSATAPKHSALKTWRNIPGIYPRKQYSAGWIWYSLTHTFQHIPEENWDTRLSGLSSCASHMIHVRAQPPQTASFRGAILRESGDSSPTNGKPQLNQDSWGVCCRASSNGLVLLRVCSSIWSLQLACIPFLLQEFIHNPMHKPQRLKPVTTTKKGWVGVLFILWWERYVNVCVLVLGAHIPL